MEIFFQKSSMRANLQKPTHTHTHTCNFLIAIFLSVFSIFSVYSVPSFATNVDNGEDATCDEDTLESPTGPVRLRAEFSPETINLKWYDENGNRVSVPTASNSCTYDTSISLPPNPTKTGYKFKGWKVMPDKPIEYIQNNGTNPQWIDTGVHGDNNNLNIIIDFMVLNLPQNRTWHTLVGNFVDEEHNLWRILFKKDNTILLYTNTKSDNSRYARGIGLNQRYLVDMDYNRVIINGTQYNYPYLTIGTTNNTTIKLWFPYISSDIMTARIYSFKVYDNGTLVRDMVPAKDDDGVVCMYDKVSGQFFYNQGTGDFVAGPNL